MVARTSDILRRFPMTSLRPEELERRARMKEVVRIDLVIGNRSQREVGVFESPRIPVDAEIDQPQLDVKSDPPAQLRRGLEKVSRIKLPGGDDGHPGPAVTPRLESQKAAFQRMNPLEFDTPPEPREQ